VSIETGEGSVRVEPHFRYLKEEKKRVNLKQPTRSKIFRYSGGGDQMERDPNTGEGGLELQVRVMGLTNGHLKKKIFQLEADRDSGTEGTQR